jgi:hypothetical protein
MSGNGSVDNFSEFRAMRKRLITLDKQDEQYHYHRHCKRQKM